MESLKSLWYKSMSYPLSHGNGHFPAFLIIFFFLRLNGSSFLLKYTWKMRPLQYTYTFPAERLLRGGLHIAGYGITKHEKVHHTEYLLESWAGERDRHSLGHNTWWNCLWLIQPSTLSQVLFNRYSAVPIQNRFQAKSSLHAVLWSGKRNPGVKQWVIQADGLVTCWPLDKELIIDAVNTGKRVIQISLSISTRWTVCQGARHLDWHLLVSEKAALAKCHFYFCHVTLRHTLTICQQLLAILLKCSSS